MRTMTWTGLLLCFAVVALGGQIHCNGEGTEVIPAVEYLWPDSLHFGQVDVYGDAVDRTFWIYNVGAPDADSLHGELGYGPLCTPHYEILDLGTASPYAIAPGDSMGVTVRFDPNAVGIHYCDILTGMP